MTQTCKHCGVSVTTSHPTLTGRTVRTDPLPEGMMQFPPCSNPTGEGHEVADTFYEHSQTRTFHVKNCPALTRESGEGCTCWWIVIERQPENPDAMFGPYPDEPAAMLAMQDSLLIQSELDPPIGGYDCWIEKGPNSIDPGDNVVLIDLNDYCHTGEPDPDEDEGPPLRIFSTGITAPGHIGDES